MLDPRRWSISIDFHDVPHQWLELRQRRRRPIYKSGTVLQCHRGFLWEESSLPIEKTLHGVQNFVGEVTLFSVVDVSLLIADRAFMESSQEEIQTNVGWDP